MSIVHCPRRRIRCLLTEDGPQGRCQSCIRLKKDCVFCSIGQEQVLDSRSHTKAESGAEIIPFSAVSLDPPEPVLGRPPEDHRRSGSSPSSPPRPLVEPPGLELLIGPKGPMTARNYFKPSFTAHSATGSGELRVSAPEFGFQPTSMDIQHTCHNNALLSFANVSVSRARDCVQTRHWRSSPILRNFSAELAHTSCTNSRAAVSDSSFSHPISNPQAWHSTQIVRSMSRDQVHDGGPPTYTPSPTVYQPQHTQKVPLVAFAGATSLYLAHGTGRRRVQSCKAMSQCLTTRWLRLSNSEIFSRSKRRARCWRRLFPVSFQISTTIFVRILHRHE